jgi:hypothetical protein
MAQGLASRMRQAQFVGPAFDYTVDCALPRGSILLFERRYRPSEVGFTPRAVERFSIPCEANKLREAARFRVEDTFCYRDQFRTPLVHRFNGKIP